MYTLTPPHTLYVILLLLQSCIEDPQLASVLLSSELAITVERPYASSFLTYLVIPTITLRTAQETDPKWNWNSLSIKTIIISRMIMPTNPVSLNHHKKLKFPRSFLISWTFILIFMP